MSKTAHISLHRNEVQHLLEQRQCLYKLMSCNQLVFKPTVVNIKFQGRTLSFKAHFILQAIICVNELKQIDPVICVTHDAALQCGFFSCNENKFKQLNDVWALEIRHNINQTVFLPGTMEYQYVFTYRDCQGPQNHPFSWASNGNYDISLCFSIIWVCLCYIS